MADKTDLLDASAPRAILADESVSITGALFRALLDSIAMEQPKILDRMLANLESVRALEYLSAEKK
jgi:hypothetical protein